MPLLSAEIRQLGGELGRARPQNGALAAIDAEFEALKARMAQWTATQMYLNFAETRRDPRAFWPEQAHHRLRRIKAAADPSNGIRGNQPVGG